MKIVNWGNRKELGEQQLQKMLRLSDEQDWLEFKSELKLFQADGKVAEKARDEFIKDILGLANGNSHTIRKTKYLIVGADNKLFDGNNERVRHTVNYRVPTQSEMATWLKNASTPAVVGLECEMVIYKGDCLFVITIPPTFDLHETTRVLNSSGGTYREHTVFMRQDEHIIPASVRDGITIQQLKHLHRQEVTNPSSTWIGAIVGATVLFIFGGANINSNQAITPSSLLTLKIVLCVFGTIFGAGIGWAVRMFNDTRYEFRYLKFKHRIILLTVIFVVMVIAYFIQVSLSR